MIINPKSNQPLSGIAKSNNAIFKRNGRLLLILLFMASSLQFQNVGAQVFADFETPGTTPSVFNGNAAVVANPDKSGANTSNNCVRYDKAAGNWHYVALSFPQAVSFGASTTMNFKIHSSTQGRVYYKFWNGGVVVAEAWAHNYSEMPAPNKWVELTMDISKAQGMAFTRLEIASGVDNDAEAIVYLDDFKLSNPLAEIGIPVLDLKIDPAIIYTLNDVTFDASASFDYNNLDLTYAWDFGDGTTETGASMVNHQYTLPGFYTASLLLSNTEGKSISKSVNLFVFNFGDSFSGLTFISPSPKTNSKIEGVFQVSKIYGNPFNPDTVSVDAVITKPDNSKDTIPCFYFIRSIHQNQQWVIDSTFQGWMLRFSSGQAGEHRVVLMLSDKSGEEISEEFTVTVSPSGEKGFVYVDPLNKQYYRHSTGESYLPIGENVAWSNKADKITDYYNHISTLSTNKANMLRYWTVTFGSQSLEAKNGFSYYKGIGNYSQQASALLDSVFDLCTEYDVQNMLTIFQHGILSENVNPNWDLNPYNKANGGFLDKPADFFNNELAKKYTKHLLRYYVARWGYSTKLFSWEFFNEVDLTGNTSTNPASWVTDVDTWHEEMGEYIRGIDPYNHIRTTSLSGWMDHPLVAAFGNNEQLDVLQFHSYDYDVAGGILAKYNNINKKTQLPIICGEFGKSELAETGNEVRRANWIGYFNHLPCLHWYWDKAFSSGWYSDFAPIGNYFAGVDLVAEGNPLSYKINTVYINNSVSAQALKTDAGNYYVYVYSNLFASNISGVSLLLENVPFGHYKLTWHNPVSGEISQSSNVVLANSFIDFEIPTFSQEVAFKLEYVSDYLHPVAIAGIDQAIALGGTANLSAINSVNPKGLPITYMWKIVQQPAGSTLTIVDPSAQSFSVTPDHSGIFLFSLVVSDVEESSLADTVKLFISAPPVAAAGSDIYSLISVNVILNGSASFDVDEDQITYLWTMISKPVGSNSTLKKDRYVDPVFRPDVSGDYYVVLVVNDGLQDSQPDTVKISVSPTGISNATSNSIFEVYPNPIEDFFMLKADFNLDKSYILELIDLTGKVLINEILVAGTNVSSKSFSLPENLGKGVYVLRVKSIDMSDIQLTKIVKL